MNAIILPSAIALTSVYVLALGIQAICCGMAMRKRKVIVEVEKNKTSIIAQNPSSYSGACQDVLCVK